MKWATDNQANNFESIVWTDESMIQPENHRTFCYRKEGQPPQPKPKPKHPYKVMVWVGILMKGAINICLINGSVDSKVYQEIILSHFKPLVDKYLPGGFLQRDNAPCHTSLSTRTFFEQNGIRVFPTPPESPDLISIENLWHELKHFLRTSVESRNKEDLIGGISAFWETMTPGHLRKVVPKVIEVRGEATGY